MSPWSAGQLRHRRATAGLRSHRALARGELDDGGLHGLDPEAGARNEADFECGSWLSCLWVEPFAQQIGELVALCACGTGDVAELFGETELPDGAVGEAHVGFVFGQVGLRAARELEDGVA